VKRPALPPQSGHAGKVLVSDGAYASWSGGEAWQAPTLLNGWVNYGGLEAPAGYMMDGLGFVSLRGLIKNGSLGAVAFVLPAARWPTYNHNYVTACATVSGVCFLSVNPSGEVTIGANASAAWTSLAGIRFQVGG
jgi:hypothetical protein